MRLEAYEPLTVPFVLHLHRLLFGHTDGHGGHLKREENLIVSYESGRRTTVFTPPPPRETEFLLTELLARYEDAKREARTHPLVLTAALVLDFLAIHPVADGNGRLARLLTTHELLAQGYSVARYVSIEQRIFESKRSYYASLYESQRDWHEGDTQHLAMDLLSGEHPCRRLRRLRSSASRARPRALAASRRGSGITSCTRRPKSSGGGRSSAPSPASAPPRYGSSWASYETRTRSDPEAPAPAHVGTGCRRAAEPRAGWVAPAARQTSSDGLGSPIRAKTSDEAWAADGG